MILLTGTSVLMVLLLAAAIIDIRTMRIPDPLNALLAATGLGATWLLQSSLLDALIGVAAGYGVLATANWFYRRARGRDGLGLGDAKLLAGAGAWLGWAGLPYTLLIAAASGLAFVGAARIAGRRIEAQDALPFGPFLCLGVAIVWIVQAYA